MSRFIADVCQILSMELSVEPSNRRERRRWEGSEWKMGGMGEGTMGRGRSGMGHRRLESGVRIGIIRNGSVGGI